MEKHEETQRRLRVAEASAEAMALRLRKVRESRAVSALTGEADLYHRVEQGLRSVEEVAAPLVAMEQKASARHEQVATSLADIDMAVRRENASLTARVQQLETRNQALNELAKGRPMRQAHMAALHRADALAIEVRHLRAANKEAHKQLDKLKRRDARRSSDMEEAGNLKEEDKVEGKEGKEEGGKTIGERKLEQKAENSSSTSSSTSSTSSTGRTSRTSSQKEAVNAFKVTTEEMRGAIRRDRVLRGLGVVDLSAPIASLDMYKVDDEREEDNAIRAKSRTAPMSNRFLRMGWAALTAMRDLMRLTDCRDAASLVAEISNMQVRAMTANGLLETTQEIEALIEEARKVEGINSPEAADGGQGEGGEGEALIVDVSTKKERKKLRSEDLQTELKLMLSQRRIMAFSQNLERKSLSDILMHFQMLMGSSSFSDIVPKMQHLLEKQRMQRRSLDAIRRIFGMGPTIVGIGGTVSSEDSVVDVIRAYTSNQGLSSA